MPSFFVNAELNASQTLLAGQWGYVGPSGLLWNAGKSVVMSGNSQLTVLGHVFSTLDYAVELTDDARIVVGTNGSIVSSGQVAIAADMDGTVNVSNAGLISSREGISLFCLRFDFHNSGIVSGSFGGVAWGGGSANLTNSGTITGTSVAVVLTTDYTSMLMNSGVIEGIIAISAGASVGRIVFENSGRVVGQSIALSLSGQDDKATNRGTIFGSIQLNGGNDVFDGSVGTQSHVDGGAGDDEITGGTTNEVLFGGAGADDLDGGPGKDWAGYASSSERVRVDLANGVGWYGEAEGDRLRNIENLSGSPHNDYLLGDEGENFLRGMAGADTMSGRGGNDSYGVDNAGDVVIEAAGGGAQDRILASVTYALGAGAEVELLQAADTGSTGALNLTGNEFAQRLIGNAGANTLDGGQGADTMTGLGGNDTYRVDNTVDVIVERTGSGTADAVVTSIGYTLAAGVEVELMRTSNAAGTASMNLTGNEFGQEITGNAGQNVLDGKGGADVLIGLQGNDIYRVDNVGDSVVEVVNGGTDTVQASVSYTLAAGVRIEQLTTTNAAAATAIDLTGNEVSQSVTGNAGNNRLDGKGGVDTLFGLGGNDTFVFSTALGAGNIDTISDYNPASDLIALSTAIFRQLNGALLDPAAFAANSTGNATNSVHRIIYETDTGKLNFDADGNGAGSSFQFAVLNGNPTMTADEFLLIL